MITGEWGAGGGGGGGVKRYWKRERGKRDCGSVGVREYTFARVWMRGRGRDKVRCVIHY